METWVTPEAGNEDVRIETHASALLLAVALVLTVLLVRADGTGDVQMFLGWGALAQEHGIVDGYKIMVDRTTGLEGHWAAGAGEYPPLGFIWLYVVCRLADAINVSHLLMFKVAILLSSFASTYTLWRCCRNLPLAAAFQSATLLSATGLGYMDIVIAPFMIGAFWAIREEHPVLGFFLMIVSILLKWQPLLVMPFLLLHLLQITDLRSVGRAFVRPLSWQLGAVAAVVLLSMAAVFADAPLHAFLAAMRHPFLSGNALNVPWIATLFARMLHSADFSISDEVAFIRLPPLYLLPFRLVFLALFALILVRFTRVVRSFANFLLFSVLGVVTYGVWNSAVHENHWFIALVPAFILAGTARDVSARMICILIAVMFNVNLFVFYGVTGHQVIGRSIGIDLSIVLALLYVAIWWLLVRYAWSVRQVTTPLGNSARRPGDLSQAGLMSESTTRSESGSYPRTVKLTPPRPGGPLVAILWQWYPHLCCRPAEAAAKTGSGSMFTGKSRLALLAGALVLLFGASALHAQISPFRGSKRVQGLDRTDTNMLFDAASRVNAEPTPQVGDKQDWSNPTSGNSGTVTITRLFKSVGLACHALRYDLAFKAARPVRTYTADWCLTKAGTWKIKG